MPRTRKTVVILVSGKAGAGKSRVSDVLQEKLTQIHSITAFDYGFGDPIKYIAKAYFGWDGEKDEKGRRLLQQIGAVGREYDENIWVKHFLNQLDRKAGLLPFNFAIIDDLRFPNELTYLQQNPLLDIVTIRVFGRGGLEGKTAQDVSENSLPEATQEHLKAGSYKEFESMLYYDFCIENSGDVEKLEDKLDIILAEIEKRYIID